ncbi:MAG TPA: hypothetical protein ENK28_14705 [Aliiroseovarius sp.]|nr:hypothetical protein [Aliiroseovarius sp.]
MTGLSSLKTLNPRAIKTWALGLLSAGLLAACGNDPTMGAGSQVAVDFVKGIGGRIAAPAAAAQPAANAADPMALVNKALAATDGKVMLAAIESRDVLAIMGVAAENHGYETWLTADRQSLILKRGVLTGSRGLGEDLMASVSDGAIALITSRRNGQATRSYQYLAGSGDTVSRTLSCQIAAAGEEQVSFGEINAKAKIMTEICSGDGLSIQNAYWVDGSGRVVKSRQWLGEAIGYIAFLPIRL